MLKKHILLIKLSVLITASDNAQAMDWQQPEEWACRPQYYWVTSNNDLVSALSSINRLYRYPRPQLSHDINNLINPTLYQSVVKATFKINARCLLENTQQPELIDFHFKSLNAIISDDLINLTYHNQKMQEQLRFVPIKKS